jgi:hypothetical protein
MTWHERVYRSLLRAYPRAFRQEYTDLMAQLFCDQLRDARSGGRHAVVALWLRSFADVSNNALSHHIRKEQPLSNAYYPLLGGLLGITLLSLMFTGPIIAIPVFVIGIIALAAWRRRSGMTLRPTLPRPPLIVLAGLAMAIIPTVLLASPVVDEENWSAVLYGVVWTSWAITAVAGLAFVALGLVQMASNPTSRA